MLDAAQRRSTSSLGGKLVYTVNYASQRSEIWRWYWRAWARPMGLWRFHALFGLIFGIAFAALKDGPFDWGYLFTAAAVGFLTCLVFLPFWPQLRFKRTVRSLTITHSGIDSTVGTISGTKPWKDVLTVEKTNGAIVITGKNKNAFIVPARAFAGDREREEFYEAARQWHYEAIA
jgi:YcxB-like protein